MYKQIMHIMRKAAESAIYSAVNLAIITLTDCLLAHCVQQL